MPIKEDVSVQETQSRQPKVQMGEVKMGSSGGDDVGDEFDRMMEEDNEQTGEGGEEALLEAQDQEAQDQEAQDQEELMEEMLSPPEAGAEAKTTPSVEDRFEAVIRDNREQMSRFMADMNDKFTQSVAGMTAQQTQLWQGLAQQRIAQQRRQQVLASMPAKPGEEALPEDHLRYDVEMAQWKSQQENQAVLAELHGMKATLQGQQHRAETERTQAELRQWFDGQRSQADNWHLHHPVAAELLFSAWATNHAQGNTGYRPEATVEALRQFGEDYHQAKMTLGASNGGQSPKDPRVRKAQHQRQQQQQTNIRPLRGQSSGHSPQRSGNGFDIEKAGKAIWGNKW